MERMEHGDDVPIFVISIAARLAGMHPQTLRQYDRLGIVRPGRTRGRGRRYSARDVAILREVQRLSAIEGVNLAGIKRILELEETNRLLREQLEVLRAALYPGHRVFAVDTDGETEWLRGGRRAGRRAPSATANPADDGARAIVVWRPRP